MSVGPRMIVLEFNELSPVLMNRFMGDGKLPNFRRLYRQSEVYLTDAGEQPPNLEPWIQWVSVHSGMPYAEHGVFHLGDGTKLKQKCVWDLLSDAGYRVWVCGSMNLRYDLPVNGWVLPDPWTVDAPPHPTSLLPYFRFVQTNVMEHTNERVPLTKADYIQFLVFLLRHGLRASTAVAIMRELRVRRDNKHRWRRAVFLDKLQYDLFRWYYRQAKPHFSTFFLNSTAHFQHCYWRNMQPELFKVKPTEEEQAEFGEAVLFGYQEMDKLLGSFLGLVTEGTTLVFCTGLSQQPCLIYEDQGGKMMYRPRDFEQLLSFAGITEPHTISPVMAEQFHVYFETEAAAQEAEKRLQALQADGRPALLVDRNGRDIFSGCKIFDQVSQATRLRVAGSERAVPFFDIFYLAGGLKSGMHHPDGMLWIKRPGGEHRIHSERVPLTCIATTILDHFSVPRPAYMRTPALAKQPRWKSQPVPPLGVGVR